MVWNTYQCYLKAALATISSELAVVEAFGRRFGAKIVRGAYMEKERKLARERGYEDPVNETYEATGEMYNRVINVSILIIDLCWRNTYYLHITMLLKENSF